jgi:hypothetical protein
MSIIVSPSTPTVAPAGLVSTRVIVASRRRKHRFLVVSAAALAVVAVTMGVSFLDSSGVSTIAVSASNANANLVYPFSGAGTTLPKGSTPLTTTAFSGPSTLVGTGTCGAVPDVAGLTTTACTAVTSNTVTGVGPSWSPSPGAAAVTTAGDLAVIDATGATNQVTVNMYITNLSALLIDYSSFALPLDVYQTTCTATVCQAWTQAPVVSTGSSYGAYLTDTSPEMTFVLPAGKYYEIVMEGTNHTGVGVPTYSPAPPVTGGIGGAVGVITTSGTGGSLSPSFYFAASAQ